MTDAVVVGLFVFLASFLKGLFDFFLSRRTSLAVELAAQAAREAAEKIQPVQMAAIEAATAKTVADTTAAQNKTIGDQNATIADMLKVQSGMVKEYSELMIKFVAAQGEIAELKTIAQAALDRAVAAETEAVALKQQVADHPQRLAQLESIIERLQTTAKQQGDVAQVNADSRNLEALNAQEALRSTPFTGDNSQAVTVDDNTVKIGDTIILSAPPEPPDS